MTQSFEDASKIGKELLDTSLKSFSAGDQGRAGDFDRGDRPTPRRRLEAAARRREAALGRQLDKAVEVQTDYAKAAYEGFVAEATKMGELYADLAKDAYKPFESIIAKAHCSPTASRPARARLAHDAAGLFVAAAGRDDRVCRSR